MKSLIKAEILIPVQSGMRRLSRYDEYELACKIRTPSYVSLEIVLQQQAVIFQDYSSVVTLVAQNTLDKEIDTKQYRFRKMKDALLMNPLGVHSSRNKAVASKERAICDMLYYVPTYYFDNIGSVDGELFHALAPHYPKVTQKVIYSLIKNHA